MQLHCTRPNCPSPINHFADLDSPTLPRPIKQKYCSACRMELILRGRYLPVSLLGQGGFGTAFLARDIDSPTFDSPTEGRCVVKLFQPPANLSPQQLATAQRLFAREAQVLERLGRQHLQIPNLYAYFPLPVEDPRTQQSEELFYLVQEYVDGEDLEKILERQGKLSEPEVEKVLRAMLKVLDFIHQNGAIHRDVKPSNIIQGKNGRLSLLDFGAVKEVTTPTGIQRGPTTICSPDFAPPEQIMNGTVDQSSDLYALAATCVVLLTGKLSSELRQSSSNTWQWETHVKVAPSLAQVLNRMLAAKASDRFPSAQAIQAILAAPVPPGAAASGSVQSVPAAAHLPRSSPIPSANSSVNPSGARPATKTAPPRPSPPPLSLPRFLGSAAFTGIESGLLGIAVASFIGTSLFGGGVWLALVAGLGVLQLRRTIEGMDLLIISGITLAAVVFLSPLNVYVSGALGVILVTALMAGGVAVVIAVIFRLIFNIVSQIL